MRAIGNHFRPLPSVVRGDEARSARGRTRPRSRAGSVDAMQRLAAYLNDGLCRIVAAPVEDARARLSALGDVAPGRLDAVLAVLLFTVGALQAALAGQGLATGSGSALAVHAFLALQTLPLVVRRQQPIVAMMVIGLAGTLQPALGVEPHPFVAVFGILVAVYSVAAYGTRAESAATAVITAVALVVVALSQWEHMGFEGVLANYVLFGSAWILGDSIRHRRAYERELVVRTALLEREQERRAEQAVAEERARIARELHDIVAHAVGVMVVQAGAARRVADRDPDGAREAVARVEAAGREALAELRRLLGVLRDSGEGAARLPQPGLAALTELVEQVRATGIDVTLRRDGLPDGIPPGVDLAAFRIVQEALTNTLKHAGPAAATVTVRYLDDAVEVAVEDDGRGAAAAASDAGGHGLVGMRERVGLYGGSFTAGPRPGGGYRIRARLPVDGAQAGVVEHAAEAVRELR